MIGSYQPPFRYSNQSGRFEILGPVIPQLAVSSRFDGTQGFQRHQVPKNCPPTDPIPKPGCDFGQGANRVSIDIAKNFEHDPGCPESAIVPRVRDPAGRDGASSRRSRALHS